MAYYLEIRKLRKAFGRLVANDDVSLGVERGEVRAVLGENGAGKSTLMSCLYGLYSVDSGSILIEGKEASIRDCREAMRLGIGMANQHFMLVDKLSVTENIILGLPGGRLHELDYAGARKRVKELSDRYGFGLDPDARMETLPVGMQQRVELLKILYRDARLIIFDEPTAVLTPAEVLEFFEIVRKFKSEGRTILFITHKLNEVMAICDSVTVLRDGKVVGDVLVRDTDMERLACMMVGREIKLEESPASTGMGEKVLEVRNLEVRGRAGHKALKGLSFSVRSGEILGIAGVDGNGQNELGRAITGLLRADGGQVLIGGADVTNLPPSALLERGLAHVPQDRRKTGLILEYSIEDNLASTEIHKAPFSRHGVIRRKVVEEHAARLVEAFNIRGAGSKARAGNLSGGNQQKVILAREFSRGPRVIVAIQPTRGLDISAMEFVRRELVKQRDAGAAILLISTELEEVMALSDTIEVLYEGAFTGTIPGHTATQLEIGLQMAGKRRVEVPILERTA